MEMDYVKKVNNLCLVGNLSENWRRFKQNYDIFEEAAGIQSQPENKRIASFLNTIGEEALELYNTFDLSAKDRKSFAKIRNAFEKHCTTKKRVVYERFKFFSHRQSETESLKSFLSDLTKMAASCEFKDQESSLIRDQFLMGILNKEMQAELLTFEDDLNFDKIVELLELLGVAKHYQEKDVATSSTDIVTEGIQPMKSLIESGTVNTPEEDKSSVKAPEAEKTDRQTEKNCKRCNTRHKYGHCPAFGRNCLKCFQLHHFAVCCPGKADNFKTPCSKCNQKHPFRNCPAFGKRCVFCHQMNHFAVHCPKRCG
ncbi:hypothetical protein HA402_014561 [Bradysia odoriphaga]|nr:hypothetical protein HA402_014561 [Bradysia odoriphaga]